MLAVIRAPFEDFRRALNAVVETPWDLALVMVGGVVTWWVYVPVHELLHALGCVATGGDVTRLEIGEVYGAALLQRFLPWVAVGAGNYAGRLSGFETHGRDLCYLATDLAPFVLTVLVGVPLLRALPRVHWRRSGRAFLLGVALPIAWAPFLSLTGDYYEIGSILVSRLVALVRPGVDVTRWRTDDVIKLMDTLLFTPAHAQIIDGLVVALALLLGAVLAWSTYLLGVRVSRFQKV